MFRRGFLLAWSLLALVKLAFVITLPLFGDEAFYWLESRYPAWSYSDLPPMTAWLVAIGSTLFPGEIGVRSIFWLLGLLLPWQIVAMTRRWYGQTTAWRAGILALILPLAVVLGVLALPDVPMLVISLFAVDRLVDALRSGSRENWLLLGVACALGLLVHYRFAALLAAMAITLVSHPAGRRALTTSRPWIAALVALIGLLPLISFNLGHDLAGLRFQFVDRHPWAWQSTGLWQIAEQALVASPVLLVLFGWTARRSLGYRPMPPVERIVVPVAVGLWALFFVLGFFADNERFRWHWSLTSYLLLMPALAARWPMLAPWLRKLTLATAGVLATLILGYLLIATVPNRGWLAGKQFPSNFSGWREAAAWMAVSEKRAGERWIADNFMLAAALRFYLRDARQDPVFVLDDDLNQRHGRAMQLAIWNLDEAAIATDPAQPGWLVVEETARRFSDRWTWYQGLCAKFFGLKLDDMLNLHDGHKRFVRWRFDGYHPQPSCNTPSAIPPLGWVDAPARVRQGQALEVFGWAMQAELGIDAVDIHIDGEQVARTTRSIEIDWVERRWGDVGDPAGRVLGFRVQLLVDALDPGEHRLAVFARRGDGTAWPLHEQTLIVEP